MWQTAVRRYRLVPTSLRAFLAANSTAAKDPAAALHSSATFVTADIHSDSIYENLAVEEALIRALSLDKDQCLATFYVNKPCVVVGRNQNLFQEVSLRRAARDGVDVARRASGGGAVFHDRQNLCFSFLTHRTRYAPEKTIQLIRLGLCCAYGIAPARLTTTGRYDLFLDGKKITGSAMRVQRDIAYHHCTLLVDTPHALLARYLHPEGEYVRFQTSSVGSVRSPVTTLTESKCVPRSAHVVEDVKRNMTTFFCSQGHEVLNAAVPWDLDVEKLRRAFADAVLREDTYPVYSLDVRQAMAENMPFVEGEGRRLARGDAVSLPEAVQRAESKTWAYAMPTFTSTVQISVEEVRQNVQTLSGWVGVVALSGLSAGELLEELTHVLFDEEATDTALRVHTTVDHRTVTRVDVTRSSLSTQNEETDASTTEATGVSEAPVEWLGRYLSALVVGHDCDAAVEGLESAGDAAVLATGFVHEASHATLDLPDVARDAAVLIVVKALLSLWRDKNVFDVYRGEF